MEICQLDKLKQMHSFFNNEVIPSDREYFSMGK